MLTSLPFWAALLLNFSNDWGLYFLMTAVPKFVNQVLGFRLDSTGLLAAVPYLAALLGNALFATVGDWVRGRDGVSVLGLRKGFLVICECFIETHWLSIKDHTI